MQIGNTGFIYKVKVGQCKNVFPISNFQGFFITYVFVKCFWQLREMKIDCWTSRHLLCERNIKLFRLCGGLNSCRKVNYL